MIVTSTNDLPQRSRPKRALTPTYQESVSVRWGPSPSGLRGRRVHAPPRDGRYCRRMLTRLK